MGVHAAIGQVLPFFVCSILLVKWMYIVDIIIYNYV